MKKLEKYLQKKGIEYKIETMGNNNYFNAAHYTANAILITFNYYDNPEQVRQEKKKEKLLKTYCKKYGYVIFNEYSFFGNPSTYSFFIEKITDYENIKILDFYIKSSNTECIKFYHDNYKTMDNKTIETSLKNIMKEYEKNYFEYMEYLKRIA